MSGRLLTQTSAATMAGPGYGLIRDAAIAVEADRIAWIGREADLPPDYAGWERTAFDGRLVTPALIDCHTHLVHGGNRAREFEMRLQGAGYESDLADEGLPKQLPRRKALRLRKLASQRQQ